MEEIRPNEEINGRYVLKEYKGRGTFGEVWLAHDLATDEDVAIKFYVALDHKGREEFIQEYRIAARLSHPNLLMTKDYGEWKNHPYLTMKYCSNGSAADLVGKLKPCEADEKTIWRFIKDVSGGLAFLHAVEPAPIVHQDIKPDNILIDSDGSFLVSDFGISLRIRNTMRKQSGRQEDKSGSPAYMGPERFSAHPNPTLASDIWSLGASVYELAEGELPFCGMGGGMMNKGAEEPSLSEGWSKGLNSLMQWCLEKDTWDRPKASQIHEITETVLKNKIKNVDVIKLIFNMRSKPSPNPNPKPVKKYALAAIVLLLVLSGVTYFIVRNSQPMPQPTMVTADTLKVDTANRITPHLKAQPKPTENEKINNEKNEDVTRQKKDKAATLEKISDANDIKKQQEPKTEPAENNAVRLQKALENGAQGFVDIAALAYQGYAPAYLHYAKGLLQSGNTKDAKDYLRKSIAKGVNVSESKKLLDVLEE